MTPKIKFNNDIIKYMSIFTGITHTSLKDCVDLDNKIIFIVDENQAGKAIGKKGANIKKLENKFNRKVKVVEYSKDPIQFIKNVTYPAKIKDIRNENNIYIITAVDSFNRGILIGRNASNLRETENIVKRYFDIEELKVE